MSLRPRLNTKKIMILILAYIAIFFTIYHYTYTSATLHFQIQKIKASHGHAYGQLYYSDGTGYSPTRMSPFLHWWGFQNKYQSFSLPIYGKTLHSLRFDPLSDTGEVIIQDMSIIAYKGFKKKIHTLDLTQINTHLMHNIKVIKKQKNYLHLAATGKDPYLEIASNLKLTLNNNNYYELLKIAIYSFFLIVIFYYIFRGFRQQYLSGEELVIVLTLLLYSGYTVLFGTQFKMAWLLLQNLPFLLLIVILKQGVTNYVTYLKNMAIILTSLTIIVLIIDYVNEIHTFWYYLKVLPNIIYAMLLVMMFIQKKEFNYHFYKYFLFYFTLFLAIFITLLHYYVIRIDTILAFGFTMSMSEWAQKNYTFWYIFLMWGTLSFFDLKKREMQERLMILSILLLSAISIFSGYPDSAKLAFVLSLIFYFLLTFIPFKEKTLRAIPILISLYILLFPWISQYYVLLSELNPKIALREGIYVIYSDIIRNNFLFGYGFNNTGSIIPIKCVSADVLVEYANNLFMRGCAPHSLPLLLWLNLGLIGMLPFSLLLYVSIKNLISLTYRSYNQAALLAMIIAYIIIITFSWGTWQPHALLTFSFFMGMLLLSLNINYRSKVKKNES